MSSLLKVCDVCSLCVIAGQVAALCPAHRRGFAETVAVLHQHAAVCVWRLTPRSLHMIGLIAHAQGDNHAAQTILGHALASLRAIDDPHTTVWLMHWLAYAHYRGHDYAQAAMLFEESLQLAQELRLPYNIAWLHTHLQQGSGIRG